MRKASSENCRGRFQNAPASRRKFGRRSARRVIFVLGLLALLAGAGCTLVGGPRFHWQPADFRVKGAYYGQPKAAINNFWTSFDFEQSKRDFARLREDNFNTIILNIPWGIFQPTVRPVTYNQRAFSDLDRILGLADSLGLKVALRVGTHDHIPREASGGKWLAATVLSDDREWAAYQDLFREVAARTRGHRNLLFLFWTFEDAGYTPDLWLHQYPRNAAAFHQWLRRRPLWYWNLLWREKNASYDSIEPPNQNREPLKPMKLRTFLEFADDLVAHRLPDACRAAKAGNPEVAVSFQPRAEVNWRHDYSRQFELPACYSFVTTWFSPYQSYLFGDKSKELSGARTAGYLPRYLRRTEQLARGLPVFVDQFNFQHFGGHAAEGELKTETEQQKFISGSLPVLLRDSLGYALWNYQDYYLNVLENGLFHMGLDGWETPRDAGRVRVAPAGADSQPEVELLPGGSLRQTVPSTAGGKEYTLSFQAKGSRAGARLQIEAQFLAGGQVFQSAPVLGQRMQAYTVKFTTPADSNAIAVSFVVPTGAAAVRLKEVMLYPWVDTGGIYDVDGNPRVALRDLFRRLNALAR